VKRDVRKVRQDKKGERCRKGGRKRPEKRYIKRCRDDDDDVKSGSPRSSQFECRKSKALESFFRFLSPLAAAVVATITARS